MAISTIGVSAGSGLQQYEQIFKTSGTWTKPTGVKTVEVTVVGGSGGCHTSGAPFTAPGAYYKTIVDVSAYSTIPVTIGAGGTYASSASTAANGGISSFGSLVQSGGSTWNSNQMGPTLLPGIGTIYAGYTTALSGGYFHVSYANGRYFAIQGESQASTAVYSGTSLSNMSVLGYLPSALGNGSTPQNYYQMTNPTSLRVYYGGGYYAFFDWNTPNVFYSTDGITWSKATLPDNVFGLVYGNNKWVAVTNRYNVVPRSTTDFATWTAGTTYATNSGIIGGLWYGNGHYWFMDQNSGYNAGYMVSSLDGNTFTRVTSHPSSYFQTQNPGEPGPIMYDPTTGYYIQQIMYTNYSNAQAMMNYTRFNFNPNTLAITNVTTGTVGEYTYNTAYIPFMPMSNGKWYRDAYRYNQNNKIDAFDPSTMGTVLNQSVTYQSNVYGIIDDGTGIYSATGSAIQKHLLYNGSVGELGSGYATAGATTSAQVLWNGSTSYYVGGNGDENGWARGSSSQWSAASAPIEKSYGSGVHGVYVNGKQGVVRVRWWA